MRSPSFHFAMRSARANEPTLSWPASQPTARWTIETSSVSPERAETIAPTRRRERRRAPPCLGQVPAWFGLTQGGVADPAIGGGAHPFRDV